jgi:aryl-alcohol dehydrogenase-like predicted oxidoreductase
MDRRDMIRTATGAVAAAAVGGGNGSAAEESIPRRPLGRTGEQVSIIGLGGFHIGMQKDEQESIGIIRAAIDAGITFMDNCWDYNNGTSEVRMGKALRDGYRQRVFLMTKIDGRDAKTAMSQLEESLQRLQTDHVDLIQLHEVIHEDDPDRAFAQGGAIEGLVRAREQGKARFIGFTAIGETQALHTLIASGAFDAAQVPFNVLNPSPAEAIPAAYPAQDYGRILDLAEKHSVGTIGIRVLAGGALSGSEARNPLGLAVVEPIGSGGTYAADVARARRLEPMLREGHAGSLTELAMRFAIATRKLSTTEIGLANIDELEAALAAVEKGPLSEQALAHLRKLQAGFIGEPR